MEKIKEIFTKYKKPILIVGGIIIGFFIYKKIKNAKR